MTKSNLQIKKFKNRKSIPDILTRITSLQHTLDFIENKQLHFSPLASFKDQKEGQSFNQFIKESREGEILPIKRRDIMYASCWFSGDETLYMWDIYGSDKTNLAIQLFTNSLIENIFTPKNFWFQSDENKIEFKPNSLHCGIIGYVDQIKTPELSKPPIGTFKDIAFSHENEFRFLLRQNYQDNPPQAFKNLKCKITNGAETQIAIKIIVSPYAESSYFEFIKKELELYSNVSVVHSKFRDLFHLPLT